MINTVAALVPELPHRVSCQPTWLVEAKQIFSEDDVGRGVKAFFFFTFHCSVFNHPPNSTPFQFSFSYLTLCVFAPGLHFEPQTNKHAVQTCCQAHAQNRTLHMEPLACRTCPTCWIKHLYLCYNLWGMSQCSEWQWCTKCCEIQLSTCGFSTYC